MVGDTLEWCFDLAMSRDEVQQVYTRNKDVFDSLDDTQKQRLRVKWRAAMDRVSGDTC